jgi:hypothetical protein
MRTELTADHAESQPALVVTYGNTTRKHRPLDRDLLILGRGRGCDLSLGSPEIAPIHCFIFRTRTGWSIRDCGSRIGTRVNGEPIEEAPLHDGDIVQIGPFCFQMCLPCTPTTATASDTHDARVLHLMRSRRRLALLALRLRRRLRDARHQPSQEQLARLVQERLREYEERMTQLAEAERELAADREILEEEFKALQERVVQAEHDLAQRQAEVEADLKARWQRFQKSCQETEQQLRQETPAQSQESRRLELRRRELDHYARHLRRSEQHLRELAAELLRRSLSETGSHEGVFV